MTVLQICVSMGLQACAKGMPILAEELERKWRTCWLARSALHFSLPTSCFSSCPVAAAACFKALSAAAL